MKREILDAAKQRLRIPELWRLLGLPGEASNSCRSPLREDANPSFSVFDDGIRWKDYATGEHGNAIDFLARARGLSNADAIAEFVKLAGCPVSPVPIPRPQPAFMKSPSPFDRSECVAAFTDTYAAQIAKWRGYTPEFVTWLHSQKLVGLFGGRRTAFPVHDADGSVVACHYRRDEDGSWRYHPAGTSTQSLTLGNIGTATKVLAFESQWDLCACADRLNWHVQFPSDTAAVATRGASNTRLLAGACRKDATVYAFAQNDEAGGKWLSGIAAGCGCKCVHVVTPKPHKDLNDWTRTGATADNLNRAIAKASPVTASTDSVRLDNAPDLRAAPPVHVSTPLITLLEELDEPERAPFPMDGLPPILAALASGVARTARVPERLSGVCALGLVSAAIGAGLEVQSDPQRTTRGNLFLLVSAETGTGKSRTFELIAAPLLDHQEKLQERWRKESAPRVQSDFKILERELANLEKKAARATDPAERERLRGEHEYKTDEKNQLATRNIQPLLLVQDATTEKLTAMMEDHGEVLFSASSDCRKVISNLLGLYTKGEQTDESFYLAGYSGDHVRVDRGSRPAVNLRRPCLGLLWFGQPDLVESMLSHESLSTSGFLPRLLICHSHAAPQRIEGEPELLSETASARWASLLSDLLGTYRHPGVRHVIKPLPEARQRFVDYHNRIVDRRGTDLRDVTGFAARWCENAWRLAVVLHAALHGADAHNHALEAATAENAIRLAEWFANEQLDILAKGRSDAAEKIETQVLELLEANRERKHLDFVTVRDVQRARIVATAEAARALLARMEADGLLVGEDVRPANGGRAVRIFRAPGGDNPVPG